MELYVCLCVSFMCSVCVLRLGMWKRSDLFSKEPNFSMWIVSVVYSIVSYVCCVSSMCCANLEFGLLAVIAWLCCLKRVRKFLSVWRTYFNGQWLHFSYSMSILLKVSVMFVFGGGGLDYFYCICSLEWSAYIWILNSIVIILVSYPFLWSYGRHESLSMIVIVTKPKNPPPWKSVLLS
jgi:hypothetical protein